MKQILVILVTIVTVLGGPIPELHAQDRRTSGGAALAALGRQFTARVVTVNDGDTIEVVTGDRRRVRIRLEGIDCPEGGEPFSNVARNFTRQLAFDKTVSVDVRDVDRYGRLVARVTSEGKDLSLELVTAGLASHYTVFSFDAKLEAAEKLAQQERRGMWVNGVARAPAPRARPLLSTPQPAAAVHEVAGPFFGNVRSRVYHAKTCRNAGCKNCTREFKTQTDAQAAGFRPAGDCLKRRKDPEPIRPALSSAALSGGEVGNVESAIRADTGFRLCARDVRVRARAGGTAVYRAADIGR